MSSDAEIGALTDIFAALASAPDPEVRARAEEELVALARKTPGDLLPALGHENARIRAAAASALGDVRHGAAEEALLELMRSEDPRTARAEAYEVWSSAVAALASLRSRSAVDDLLAALAIDDHDVRADAIWALGEIGDERARGPLRALTPQVNDFLRGGIQEALAKIGDAARR